MLLAYHEQARGSAKGASVAILTPRAKKMPIRNDNIPLSNFTGNFGHSS